MGYFLYSPFRSQCSLTKLLAAGVGHSYIITRLRIFSSHFAKAWLRFSTPKKCRYYARYIGVIEKCTKGLVFNSHSQYSERRHLQRSYSHRCVKSNPNFQQQLRIKNKPKTIEDLHARTEYVENLQCWEK